MWILLLFALCATGFLVTGFGDIQILGKGEWLVLNILECEDQNQYELRFDITRRKINRTHDCFSMFLAVEHEINDTYGMDLIAHKEVDGGFKFFQRFTDESFCKFVEKYAGVNWEKVLFMGGLDPPKCPIPPGDLVVKDFVMDYQQLTAEGLYGVYDTHMYLMYMGERVGCIRCMVRFEKERAADDDDCAYDDDDY